MEYVFIVVLIGFCIFIANEYNFKEREYVSDLPKWRHRPLPNDYFESHTESKRINKENGLTWQETYLKDLKEYETQE